MAIQHPEKPLLLYPSIIRQLGIDAALLFSLCHELLTRSGSENTTGQRSVCISKESWQQLCEYWTTTELMQLVDNLRIKQALLIQSDQSGSVTISEFPTHQTAQRHVQQHAVENQTPAQPEQGSTVRIEAARRATNSSTTRLPVIEQLPRTKRPLPRRNSLQERGPAPAFGGSIGWQSNSVKPQDHLQQIFAQQEEKNQQLHPMHLGWKPSEQFYAMLPHHKIPESMVESCLDEFILHFIHIDHKEVNWDQKFLAWVKRNWVKLETQSARDKKREQQSYSGVNHENTGRDSRENRKRVTAAIMDIKDTDW